MEGLLDFSYEMDLTFTVPVTRHSFEVKCMPRNNLRQQILELHMETGPYDSLGKGEDGMGNQIVYGRMDGPHDRFFIRLKGQALTRGGPMQPEDAVREKNIGFYRTQSSCTVPGFSIRQFYKEITNIQGQETSPFDGMDSYGKTYFLMRNLYEHFQYVSGSTNIYTTAEEAFAQGKGVCQDYAHILLAMCRMSGIPARYVVGFMIGEGYSHAWVEICQDGYWYGFDPTNNLLIDENYIKVSSGRDYNDCIMDKGTFTGAAGQEQKIKVIVKKWTLGDTYEK